ncbi:hypothetical protein EON64_02635 [archaeon]|nr:MAG: hypothetical protein EON64_02635 [archaeon]
MSAFASAPNCLSDGQIWAKSIVFSNQPKHYTVYVEELSEYIYNHKSHNHKGVLNYSQIYDACSPGVMGKLIPPADIRTGDIVQISAGPRGVGAHYAMWLYKDLVQHDLSNASFVGESPVDHDAKKRDRENEAPLDPYTWGLEESELKKLKRIVSIEDYEEMQEKMKAFLLPKYQQLFDIFQTEEGLDYEDAINSLRFPDDHAEVGEDLKGA